MKNKLIQWILGVAMVAVLAVAVILGVVYAIASQKPHTSSQNTSSNSSKTNSDHGEAGQDITITYTDKGFLPDSYMVKAGGTVTVENKSSRDLEFSSGPHPVHTAETELNMGVLRPSESGKFTVTKVGTWSFHNHLSEQDTGSLMVMQ